MQQSFVRLVVRAVFVLAILFGFNSVAFASPLLVTQQQDPSSIPRYLTDQLIPEANQSSGALIHDYPIQVPPGRNGLQPDLKLTYNNQGIEEGSIFGAGWSMSIPSIERINRKGSEQLYAQDYFFSSLSGELASTTATTWGAKVDNGDFLKYTFASSTWTVVDKKGTIYKFGSTSGARQDDPNDSTRINKWVLEEVRDTNDNYIKYVYYKDAGQIYPSQIVYTGNGTTDGVFEVDFQRESRSDVTTSSRPQFNVISNYRISEIDTKVSGTLAHKYVLSYSNGANGSRSILISITESGIDDSSNTTTLPPTVFTYQGQITGWTATSTYASPYSFTTEVQTGQGTLLADVNGDGLPDVLYSGPEWNGTGFSGVSHVWLNNGNGWALDASWSIPEAFSNTGYGDDVGTRVVDVNGDGLVDIISTKYVYVAVGDPAEGFHHWDPVNKVYINNGSGWTYDSSWVLPSEIIGLTGMGGDGGYSDNGTRIFDVNGDGLPDIISAPANGDSAVYLNTGSGWVLNTNWVMPVRFLHNYTQLEGTELSDVNGDGLLDVLFAGPEWNGTGFSGVSHVWLNNGNGWALDASWSIPEQFVSDSVWYLDTGTRVIDINGDGLADIVYSAAELVAANRVYINTGHGWNLDASWSAPVTFTKCPGVCFKDNGVRLADVNGDGITDLVHAGGGTPVTYLGNSRKIDALTQITNPNGGSTTITYKSSAQYTNGSTLLNPNLPIVLDTVSQVSISDGLGNTSTTQYKYEGGKMYFNGPFDRKFAGYSKVTTTDAVGNNTINYYHQGDTTNSAQGEYDDDISKIGKIYQTETTGVSGNVYSKTINKWDKYDLGGGKNFIKQIQQLNFTYDGDATHKDRAETYSYDNANGNITQKIQLGRVTGANDGTYTDVGTDDFTTTYTYASNPSANILGLLDDVVVTDHGSVKAKEDRYYYDTQTLGGVLKGNKTKHEQWKSGLVYINTQKTYDGTYGLVTISSDARGKNTGYSYDSYNVYPATITDPLSHATSYTYDYSSGQVKQKTDPNTRVFQSIYDGLDRLIAEKQPDQTTPSVLVVKTAYVYNDTPNAVSVHKTDNLDDSVAAETYTYFDGLGRKIQERKEAIGTSLEVRDYIYNNLGLIQKESLPYFSLGTSGEARSSATTTSSLYTTYSYDPLRRIIASSNAVGVTSNAYSDWKTTITDPRGKTRDLFKDAYDNLTQVNERNGGSTYSTYYIYNYLGNLTRVTDATGNVRNFTYDKLGRNLTAQDLRVSGDTSYGTWTYTYDNAGNLTRKVDPKNQTINYTYDSINRPLTEDYTGAVGIEATYSYDSGVNGVGHLTGLSTANLTQTNTYNSIGFVASENKVINSATYSTSYTYNIQGNQVIITNPDSSQVKYIYNPAGLLSKVQTKESVDASFVDVVSNFDYSPTRQVTNAIYANGVRTANTYDSANLYRLTNKTSAIGGALVENPAIDIYNPVVHLDGASLVNINVGDTWIEPGYSAIDAEDGDRTSFVTITGSVNTVATGTYQLLYDVVDSQGAPAEQKIRTVMVNAWSTSGVVKTLVVGAGGGGGQGSFAHFGGGGGAGGFQYNPTFTVTPQVYSIVVGSAGLSSVSLGGGNFSGGNGGDSVFGTITAFGGGGGGSSGAPAQVGASGGGGADLSYTTGATGISGQGYAGSNGQTWVRGGAGGGSSSAASGGTVGAGTASSISGASLIYAGGSYGGINTGNGGWGGTNDSSSGPKGVVIISFKYNGSDGIDHTSTGGTITYTDASNSNPRSSPPYADGYQIHTFTSSGTWTMVANSANTNPVISLVGSTSINKNVGDIWVEPGYSATDAEDGDRTSHVTVTGSVNTTVAGIYHLAYDVIDSRGAPATEVVRTVVVRDAGVSRNTNPVITLTGSTYINLTVGDTWVEPGYSATDAEDGSRTSFVTVTGTVSTSTAGVYQLVYSVSDTQGAPAEGKIRTIAVSAPVPGTVKTLVVGGGGGGGYGTYQGYQGGSGGAGGYLYNTALSINPGTHTITVGAGGNGTPNGSFGSNGGASSFSTVVAYGGGVGGTGGYSVNWQTPGSGGSGGGGSFSQTYGVGTGTVGQGYNGVYSSGGGSSGVGTQYIGGPGTSNSISGSAVTYAVGGSYDGGPGATNRGNGGGSVSNWNGSNGGSGIVIISYPTDGSSGISISSTGGTITTVGNQRIHTFTTSGTWTMVPTPSANPNAPVITLAGAIMNDINVGDTWTEPGYFATDVEDGSRTSFVAVTGTVSTSTAGVYQLVYSVVDTQGSPAERKIRTVVVHAITNTNPVITLTGESLINLNVGDAWVEPGYSATDTEDGDRTSHVVVTGTVSTSTAGTYHLTYNVVDSMGLPAASKTRTVVVHTVGGNNFQNINYTYDANGNITQVVDASNTNASKTVAYTYDDLNRMLSATATNVASGTSAYTNTYAYDALGNITSGPLGSYTYAGNTGGSYANPHAVTTIASSTLTYDNNGNTITSGSAYTNTWDYNNRITQTTAGSSTLAYTYDPAGQRLTYAVGTSTVTVYPSMYYNTDGTNITKHIFANGMEIATVTGSGASSTPHYVLTDNLLGSTVTTSPSGAQEEMVDYLPYGSIRLNEKSGTYTDQRKYAGSEYDSESGLNYMNARYYDGGRGQFISQDPVFWELGQTKDGRDALVNPQAMNSYAYANDNPVVNRDPSGRCPMCILFAVGGAIDAGATYYGDVMQNRASGAQNQYAPASSFKEYATAFAGGGVSMAFLGANKIGSGIFAGAVSIAEDRAAGRTLDYGKAGFTAVGTMVTGAAFKSLAGVSPLEKAGMSLSDISSKTVKQGLKYETVQGTFQTGGSAVMQNIYQSNGSNQQSQVNTSNGSAAASRVINNQSTTWKK